MFLTKARTFDVYDSTAGTLVHSYPVPPRRRAAVPAHLDTYFGYALYAAGKALHVVKLATGKDAAWPR